jgi:hypothetical protein
METAKLRSVQQPSQVEQLLEAYVFRGSLVPPRAEQVRDPHALHLGLQRILTRARQQGQVWACWTRGLHTWLFTAAMSLPLSRERGMPVLQVSLYDEGGELKEAGTWVTDRTGQWCLCGE